MYDVYGEKSLTERQFQNWFARFHSEDFHLKDAPRSGRPTEVDDDKIKAMIENNQRSTTREIAEKLNISHTCVQRHLKQLGYVNKLDIWVPQKLNKIQFTKRVSICESLLKRNETDPFLKRIITGDEKWVFYDNVVRKRSWSKPKWACTINIKSRYSSKEGYAECLVGFQRYCLFWAAPKEQNYQFECLLSPANVIGQRNQGKAARTGNS